MKWCLDQVTTYSSSKKCIPLFRSYRVTCFAFPLCISKKRLATEPVWLMNYWRYMFLESGDVTWEPLSYFRGTFGHSPVLFSITMMTRMVPMVQVDKMRVCADASREGFGSKPSFCLVETWVAFILRSGVLWQVRWADCVAEGLWAGHLVQVQIKVGKAWALRQSSLQFS